MESISSSNSMDAAADQDCEPQQPEFHLNFVDELDEASTYMPSPFCSGSLHEQLDVSVTAAESIATSPANSLGQIPIPTPPPERSHNSPDSTHSSRSHGSCISAQLSASATSDSYIKGSSLEESPVSSPSSSCAGSSNLENSSMVNFSNCDVTAGPDIVKRESCIRSTMGEIGMAKSDEDTPADSHNGSHQQNVPKNIKLPQRKGGMQLWQFLYALLNDPDEKYKKLIEWTANNISREFRLLEPEAIAIWWGEHKNKKNMSYDKLSRSLRYYYDKGIIRKISGERYVYQFCIDPELMYKHIGNSDSRPKLKPMPHSAYIATTSYQTEHGCLAAASSLTRDCFVAQDPLSLGIMPGHLISPRSAYHPPPGYNAGISPFLSHGYTDINGSFHHSQSHLGYSNAFFPSSSYDVSAMPHMSASLGYTQNLMEAPTIPLKAQLPPLRKSNSYDMPNLTHVSHLKYENESLYGKPSSTISNMKYESESSSYGKSPMLLSNPNTLNIHTLSPPPLTSNKVSSPITPSFPNRESPLSHSYSNHSSPHAYPVPNDPLGFDDLMPFSSANEYPSSTLAFHVAYSTSNNSHSQVTSTTVATPWEDL